MKLTLDQEKQIKEILLLEEDWDDNGAIKTSKRATDKAVKSLELILPYVEEKMNLKLNEPIFCACGDGSVEVYSTKFQHYDFILNVSAIGNPSFCYLDFDGNNFGGQIVAGF